MSRSCVDSFRSYGHEDSWFGLPTLYICINILGVNISLDDQPGRSP